MTITFHTLYCQCPDQGYVVMSDALDYNTKWSCQSCGHSWENNFIVAYEKAWEDALDQLIGKMTNSESLEVLPEIVSDAEEFVQKGTSPGEGSSICFSSSHYFMMKIKSHLINLYGSLAKGSTNDVTTKISLHQKRLELCKEFICVFSKVEDGAEFTDWWAVTAHEKLKSELVLDQIEGRQDMQGLCKKLKTYYIPAWEHIEKVLQVEPKDSYSYQIGISVGNDIKAAKEMVRMAEYL